MLTKLMSPKGIVAAFTFVFSFIIYVMTMAPTTSFWDCGEFIACAYTLGIPHPPGSPLYILVGRIFSVIPFEQIAALFMSEEQVQFAMPFGVEIAWRVNLMSPILSALTVMFTFLIIVRLLEMWQGKATTWEQRLIQYASGAIGSLAFAFSDSHWFNAVEAEVYAASIFFTAIVVWLILRWAEQHERSDADKWLLLIFYLVGLALGVHLLNLLALPTIFLIMYFQRKEISWESFLIFGAFATIAFIAIYPGIVQGLPAIMDTFSLLAVGALVIIITFMTYYFIKAGNRNAALALMCLLLVIVGYSTYAAIYIRSGLNPMIDENDPNTTARFVSYLNREQYGDWPIFERRAEVWEYQIKKMYIRYFGWQFIGKGTEVGQDGLLAETISFRGLYGLPLLFGLLGIVHHFLRDWRRAFSILVLFVMTGIAIVIYLNQENPQPRERDYAYTGSFFAFALWIGIGVSFLLELARDVFHDRAKLRQGFIAVMSLLVFAVVPVRMLAFNYHDHSRAGNFVAHDYSQNILETCEPNGIIFTNGDNDTFPLWFLQNVYGVRTDVRIVNLSLLNTNWYIRQLRDMEPKVPISFTDDQIDALAPRAWPDNRTVRIPVPPEIRDDVVASVMRVDSTYQPDSSPEMVVNVKPTLYTPMGNGIRVQDIMILHILAQNQFQRPVYFAVTVAESNKLGMQDYMRMDGLAFKVLPVKVPRRFVDPEIMRKNMFEKYVYRNLDNPDVYYNDNIIALLGNYRSAFMTLLQHYQQRDDKERMLEVLDRMSEVVPEEVIPPPDLNYSLYIGRLYQSLGRPEEFKRRLDNVWENPSLEAAQKVQILPVYAEWLNDRETAEARARSLLDDKGLDAQTKGQVYRFLSNLKRDSGKLGEAIELARQWLQVEPDNAEATRAIQMLETMQKSTQQPAVQPPAQPDSSEQQ